jgi:hypothetical protein
MRRLPEEGDEMIAQSWPELARKVADVIRENEVLKWELVKVKDENAKLEQALEQACRLIANKPNDCPVVCKAREPWKCGDETCMKMLIRYFKEATQ